MNKPNFFIAGAPKCGTTALSEYLRDHPNIYISEPKEPHYFTFDFEQYRVTKTWSEYSGLFSESTAKHTAIGEGSVFYLCSTVALDKIKEYDSQAKIIVMLRNPVDMIYSFHSQLVFTADESEKSFEKAWRLQATRKQGKQIPSQCREAAFLQYAEMGKLGEQVERLQTIFPAEQVKIILFEDFVKSTKDVYDEVLEFLAVPNDERTEFVRINENKTHKMGAVGNFTAKPPALLTNVALKARDMLGIKELGILDTIRSFNTKVAAREPLSEDLRADMMEEFSTDIQKLAQLINRDLSHWLTAKSLNK
ncbi:sulfotransferase domain-containing protein [Waterburya agarophytonicola K14]|uniref:Sulfotransferase domain-containing protein n=1 Tax=Waterburya agarophytonicola KI4 TaxID=2874699 RepID=A0A964BRJ3_9CYAN|nr:sulfotransferase domain-containing protein [Waterburya agarophytonicola]MCC0177427.1 sulfotransferase domain-containing protein [Waterburya agarophytonicola KI4]